MVVFIMTFLLSHSYHWIRVFYYVTFETSISASSIYFSKHNIAAKKILAHLLPLFSHTTDVLQHIQFSLHFRKDLQILLPDKLTLAQALFQTHL